MKKGINAWSFPQGSVKEKLTLAKKAGFEGVELSVNNSPELTFDSTDAEVKKIRKIAEDKGLRIYSLCSDLCWELRLTDDDATINFNNGETLTAKTTSDGIEYENGKEYWGFQHIREISDFYQAVLNGTEPKISGKEALKIQKLICEIYENNFESKETGS